MSKPRIAVLSHAIALTALACLASCASLPGAGVNARARDTLSVKIIALNDFHGHLEAPDAQGEDASTRAPVGGADYLAGHIGRLRAANPDSVVVAAGDLIGASPLISAAFSDEPAIEVLNRAGLEFASVGNHEFDKGAAELLRMQNGGCRMRDGAPDAHGCRGALAGTPVPFEGARFRYLSANVVARDSGKPLLPAYGVKNFAGRKIAFIGMTLKETPGIVMPSGVAGLAFEDEAQTVNRLVPELRAQGIEAIVVLLHQGGVQRGAQQDINGCAGGLSASPIAGIVSRFDDAVDLVISGHTHAAYICRLPNARGRAIPVTSAGAYGRLLTDIDMTLGARSGDVAAVHAVNRLVSHQDASAPPDGKVAGIVAAYRRMVEPVANAIVGSIRAALPNVRVDGACNMPAGNLVADAALAATTDSGAEIAFMNGGGVRSPGYGYRSSAAGEGDGIVTYGEAFAVQPFGNSLITMSLSARQIRDALEEQFAGCRGQSRSTTRLMLPSAGLRYAWDGAKPCDARISDVRLNRNGATEIIVDRDGRLPHPERRYRVTVNSFMADGGDGMSTFTHGTRRVAGMQDIDATIAFLSRYRAPHPPYDPSADEDAAGMPRLRRLGSGSSVCPTGADTNP